MKKVDLEILVSTMNRTDLSFLKPMFPDRELSEFNILVVNQTTPDKTVESTVSNIRTINSFEYGLSKSRNLAIENSIGDIALIADDDIVYLPGFERKITQAFKKYSDAALISFQFLGEGDLPQKKYINRERKILSLKKEPDLSSWEIALNPRMLRENSIGFNEYFGLGANFPSGEETLLIKEVLNNKLPAFHVPEAIGLHPHGSTGTLPENENHIRGISALKYLKYGKLAPLSLTRFVYLSVRKKKIPFWKVIWAHQIGLRTISECRKIFKNEENPFQ